jgi:uracil-DNA glycosylase family 4
MPVTGEGRRKILVIGEAPGEEEDERNTHFIGPAGQRLRAALRAHGISLDRDCWSTNALICHPPNGAAPTEEQVGHCLPNLTKTIETYKPEAILACGGPAIEALMRPLWKEAVGPVIQWVGWQIPAHRWNAWVYPTWSPNYVLRAKDPVLDIWFDRHIEALADSAGRPWDAVPDYKSKVEVILDPAKAAVIIAQMLERGGMFAFDFETNMLKPDAEDARIISCSICWRGKRTIAYPWHGPAITATQEFLRSPYPKIASNMKFEQRWTIRTFKHEVRGWYFDTMLAAHVLDPRRGICSIKFQSLVNLGAPIWNAHIEPFLRSKGTREVNQILREIDIQDLLLYNGLDSLLEYLVAERQMEKLGYGND